ncbi:MAG: hypothetical protein HY201_05105 [Nitrospirae bacterium]|nr:hypothetical protein [Candidatus Troglogloeales bacterium]
MIDLKKTVNDFVQSIPAAGQGGYKDPAADATARTNLVEGFQKVRRGQLLEANTQLTSVNYKAEVFTDSVTGREVVVLQEQKVNGVYPRAWGLYIISWPSENNISNLVVEVPHACPTNGCSGGDTDSHLVGVEVFQSADAHYLFINGAQRNATSLSDVAHQLESPFEKIHEATLDPAQMGPGADAKVVQTHRFLTGNHNGQTIDTLPPVDNTKPGTGGVANIVVSNGENIATGTPAETIAFAIEAKDASFFSVCLASGVGTCSDLAATTNVQKNHMFGGVFVHIEANESVYVCGNPCRRDQLAQAIASAMNPIPR